MKYLKTFEAYVPDNTTLVIVDVQKEYESNIHFDVGEMLKWAQTFRDVYVLFNGPDLGFGSEDDLREWYGGHMVDYDDYDDEQYDAAVEQSANDLGSWEYFDKGYAFFRDFMDEGILGDDDIVKVGKWMVSKNYNDLRDVTEEEWSAHPILSELEQSEIQDMYSFIIPDAYEAIAALKRRGKLVLAGGGQEECLREVMLLCEMADVDYELERQYVY
jgi:hypothetical protein